MLFVNVQFNRRHPDVDLTFERPDELLFVSVCLNLTEHLVESNLAIKHLFYEMLVLGVEKHVSRAAISLLVERADYILQSEEPDDEKEPISHDQLALSFQRGSIGNLGWDVGQRPTVWPILFQVS